MPSLHSPRGLRAVACLLVLSVGAALLPASGAQAAASRVKVVSAIKGLPSKPVIYMRTDTRAVSGGERAATWPGLRVKIRGKARPGVRLTIVTQRRVAKKGSAWERVSKKRTDRSGTFSAVVRGKVQKRYFFRWIVAGRNVRTYYSPAADVTFTDYVELAQPTGSSLRELTVVPGTSLVVYDLPSRRINRSVYVSRIGVFDPATGQMHEVDPLPAGVVPNGSVDRPNVSPNGRYVAFYSDATNLTGEPDTNQAEDAFVKDLTTGVITRVNLGGWGTNYPGQWAPDSAMWFTPDSRTLVLSGGLASQQAWSYDLSTGVGHQLFGAGCSMSIGGLTPDGKQAYFLAFNGATRFTRYVDLDDFEVHEVPFASAGDTAPFENESYTNVNAWPVDNDLVVVKTWRDEDVGGIDGTGTRWGLWRPSTGETVGTSVALDVGYFRRGRFFVNAGEDSDEDTARITVPVSGVSAAVPLDLSINDEHLITTDMSSGESYDVDPSGGIFAYQVLHQTPDAAWYGVVVHNLRTGASTEIPNASWPVFTAGHLAVVRGDAVVLVPVPAV